MLGASLFPALCAAMPHPRLLDRVLALDASRHAWRYTGLCIGGRCVGQVLEEVVVPALLGCRAAASGDAIFERYAAEAAASGRALRLTAAADATFESRTLALESATNALIACGAIARRHGEFFAVTSGWGAEPVALVDRNAAQVLGTTSAGVHVHCFVPSPDASGMPCVWLAKRAASKSTWPSRWDPTAAGDVKK